ncbi:MAG: hypothetical protein M1840_007985 [Geoglossum simile]|nr:MAG: hypothetical protein M1840_007985 [Geoglossum simile]
MKVLEFILFDLYIVPRVRISTIPAPRPYYLHALIQPAPAKSSSSSSIPPDDWFQKTDDPNIVFNTKRNVAEEMDRSALGAREVTLGGEHPNTLTSISNLGSVLSRQGKYEEAEAMHRQAFEGYEKVLGPEHPSTLTSANNLGSVLEGQGKYEEAEVMLRWVLETREKVLGPEHPSTLASANNLGLVLARQGKCEEAEAMHRWVLEGYEKVHGYEGKKAPGTDDNKVFSRLALFDTIFVIDDTGSMQVAANSNQPASSDGKTRWNVLTQSMRDIGNIAAECDLDGVDIHFLISTHLNKTNIRSRQEVLNLLAQVDLGQGVGGTFFAVVLAEILGPYVARYKDYFVATKRREKADKVKPLNVVVLTDGKADDARSTKRLIIRIGKQLDGMNAPDTQIGLRFLQVGDDEDAAEWLKSLDNDLEIVYDVRDYVDTRTFDDFRNSEDFAENLREILLGAIDRDIDNS